MSPRTLHPEPRHHPHPYRPMPDCSVADELAFASWPDEQKRIARAVLTEELWTELLGEQSEWADARIEEVQQELSDERARHEKLKRDIQEALDDDGD